MSESNKQSGNQKDANLAADTRPVPSQAEGDAQTVEQDLLEKEHASSERDTQEAGTKS